MHVARKTTHTSQAVDAACAMIRPHAIARNLGCLRERLTAVRDGAPPFVWAVIKANAYGHDMALALQGLAQADGVAVRELADAYRLRELGWRKPVLVIGLSSRASLHALRDPLLQPLHLVIDSEPLLAQLERLHVPPPHVWLRYSGTLCQAGLGRRAYAQAWQRLQALQQAGRVAGVGHMQHYANSENGDALQTERRTFEPLFDGLSGVRCTENSAAVLLAPAYAGAHDWVRSGIALYGISPLADVIGADLGLQPAMQLQAPIIATQQLAAGQTLGYGGAFRAGHDLRIGLVACGYADGYPRNLTPDCPVSINGRSGRIVGRVAMDTLTVDLSSHPQAGVGTPVTLWGDATVPIERVAQYADTIPAQLCSSLMARVPRLAC